MKKKIYILSKNENIYSTQAIMQGLLHYNLEVVVLDYSRLTILSEHNELSLFYDNKILEMPDFLIPRISVAFSYPGFYLISAFERLGVPTLTSSLGMKMSKDKIQSFFIMNQNGIPLPKTIFCSKSNILEEFNYFFNKYPIIIKETFSTQGAGVFLARNSRELELNCQNANTYNSSFSIQEFISESSGEDLRVFVVGGKVIAAMKRKSTNGDFRANIHLNGVGEKVELKQNEIDIAEKCAKLFNLDIAGVDILRSVRGPLVLEINSTPGLEGIEKYSGVSVRDEIAKFILSKIN